MHNFLIVKLLDNAGPCLPTTFVYGDVEIRPSKSDSEKEKQIIKSSIEQNKQQLSSKLNSRICCIIKADSQAKAISLADQKFIEILDLKSKEYSMSNISLSKSGFIKNLETRILQPLVDKSIQLGNVFIRQNTTVQTYDQTQYTLFNDNELTQRYKKSLHWSRHSKHEQNLHLKIIFDWFAVEALLKEDQSDSVGTYIRWFLGFPNGRATQFISHEFRERLKKHEKYNLIDKALIKAIEDIRELRNDSIHHGSRNIDYGPEKLYFYSQIMLMGTARCQNAILSAVSLGVTSLPEFKEYLSIIFENNKDNLINDIHGNVIFSLSKLINT